MNHLVPDGAEEGGGDGVRRDEAAGEGEPGPQLRPLPRPLQELVQGTGLHLRLAEQLQGARHGLHEVAGAADVPGGHLSTVDTLPGELELLLEVDHPPPEPHVLPLQPLGLGPLLGAGVRLLAAPPPPPHLVPPAQQLQLALASSLQE